MSKNTDRAYDPRRRQVRETHALWGRGLRFVLVGELMNHRELTVRQLAAFLREEGHVLEGRPSKVISDALRWEVRRGRVRRVGRGRYRFVAAPASTRSRIRIFATRCRNWLAACRHGIEPPMTPPDRRAVNPIQRHRPQPGPPWRSLGWLWSM